MIEINKISDLINLNKTDISKELETTDFHLYYNVDKKRAKIVDQYSNKFLSEDVIKIGLSDNNLQLFKSEVENLESNKIIKISIDISCMAREMIAAIFALLNNIAREKTIEIVVIYALAIYAKPSGTISSNDSVAPIHPDFAGWFAKPNLPILAIVGLGYEKDKALGAIEFIEAGTRFIFVPNSSESQYKDSVKTQNLDLLQSTDTSRILQYDLDNPVVFIRMLNSLITEAKKTHKIVLFPFGPKIFFAGSLVIAMANPEISVWHVSGDSKDINHCDQNVAEIFGFRMQLSHKTV